MQIRLTKGKKTLIDKEDAHLLGNYKWAFNGFYAVRTRRKKDKNNKTINETIYLHKLILGAKKGQMADHINGNTLDNRKKNLRLATHAQNVANSKPKKSKYATGVYFDKRFNRSKPWFVYIKINKKPTYLGSFKTESKAADVYKKKHKQIFGEYSFFNRSKD